MGKEGEGRFGMEKAGDRKVARRVLPPLAEVQLVVRYGRMMYWLLS